MQPSWTPRLGAPRNPHSNLLNGYQPWPEQASKRGEFGPIASLLARPSKPNPCDILPQSMFTTRPLVHIIGTGVARAETRLGVGGDVSVRRMRSIGLAAR